jgi:hypothetical protein
LWVMTSVSTLGQSAKHPSPEGGCYEIQNRKAVKQGDFSNFKKCRFKSGEGPKAAVGA